MEQMIFEQVVAPVVKFLTGHIIKHVGYATCSTNHVNNMRNKLKALEDTSADVQKHMDSNHINNKEIPTAVPDWLTEVENLKEKVESISSNGIGCLNVKMRYRAGRNAFKAKETIEELITKNSEFIWSDVPIPTGRVNPQPASPTTPTPSSSSSGGDGFKSRETPFNDALKFLQQDDNKCQVIALCGMGGVGKTTMMEQLKTVANDKDIFNWIVKVVIGRNPNMLSVQNDIALQLGGEGLREETLTSRADSLCRRFNKILEDDKKKILVILDDVWGKIELKDFGLTSPLTNGVKLLLTSRDSNTCTQIAADVVSMIQVVRVDVLEEAEAQAFFSQITGVSEEDDHDQYQIGRDIVKKCGFLPLAIKLIGKTLKYQENYAWRSTLQRLNKNNIDEDVEEIIKISYEYIRKEEDKENFLLCGLFPEDSDIAIEDLTRYAWGLKLFKDVLTLGDARDMVKTCVHHLINANLLMNGDDVGYVKMHDLMLAFVLGRVSKGEHAWVINHGDVSKWVRDETRESCKRISLTCKGMSEISRDLKYPNLSLLQLMNGDLSFKFPEDFYKNMGNLQVIAFYDMNYPLLPRSPQCSATNLKTLILDNCNLMADCSFVGDLVNLEVLSFAHSGIHKLPSTIGALTKLKVLDLTGCINLHIDDGVFKNLENLEELYMIVSKERQIRFTDTVFKELQMLLSQLCALEVEFVEKKTLENLSFRKLHKFKISIGCMWEDEEYSFKNTLKLATDSKNDLHDWKINKLFKKTEELYLQVKDMIGLEDIVSIHPYDQLSFSNLRDLMVYDCVELKYLCTISVANGLRKLERLWVSSCSALEALVHNDGREINCVDKIIKFDKLKFLCLENLPRLVSLFLIDNVVELPQLVKLEVDGLPNFTSIYPDKNHTSALFNSQVRISGLKKLRVMSMEKLKQIWACNSIEEGEVNNMSMLRAIRVFDCHSLVNMFPTNPMRLLNHLEKLTVGRCNSIEVIFNIDMECVGHEISKSSLRRIHVFESHNFREVWRIKGGENKSKTSIIYGFEAAESIWITGCKRFRNIHTPPNTNKESINVTCSEETPEILENNFDVAFPSGLISDLPNPLSYLLLNLSQVDVVPWSLCQYSKEIQIISCHALLSMIPSYAVEQMRILELLEVKYCARLMEVFETQGIKNGGGGCSSANTDEGNGGFDTTPVISKLENMNVARLFNLKKLIIMSCKRLQHVFTFSTLESLRQLEELMINGCKAMEVIVKKEIEEQRKVVVFPRLKSLQLFDLPNLKGFFLGVNKFQWPLLEKVMICQCPQMMVFTFGPSIAPELKYMHTGLGRHNLECGLNFHVTTDLHKTSTSLERLPWSFHNLIELHMKDVRDFGCVIPSIELLQIQKLERIQLKNCSNEEVFVVEAMKGTNSESQTHVVEISSLTQVELENLGRLKYIWKSNHHKMTTILKFPNLTTLSIDFCGSLKHVFTSSMVGSLQQLQHLHISYCKNMEVIVKVEEEYEIECDAQVKEIVTLPCLKSLKLVYLNSLKGFCLGKDDFTCPSLHDVQITTCPNIIVFTKGHLATPALNVIDTDFGRCYIEEDLNSFITTKQDEGFEF